MSWGDLYQDTFTGHVHWGVYPNSWHAAAHVSTCWWVDKTWWTTAMGHYGSVKMSFVYVICDSMDEPGSHCAGWDKLAHRQKCHMLSHMQSKTPFTEAEVNTGELESFGGVDRNISIRKDGTFPSDRRLSLRECISWGTVINNNTLHMRRWLGVQVKYLHHKKWQMGEGLGVLSSLRHMTQDT